MDVGLWLFLNPLKCALQKLSLKAHLKAANIFVGFFLATRGQMFPGAARVWAPGHQIPSLMPWPLGHGAPMVLIQNKKTIKKFY